jgi:hypothetical protein
MPLTRSQQKLNIRGVKEEEANRREEGNDDIHNKRKLTQKQEDKDYRRI